MKRMLENFESSILSRNEMKNVNGGHYACKAGNLVSTSTGTSDPVKAMAICNRSTMCSGNSCTLIMQ